MLAALTAADHWGMLLEPKEMAMNATTHALRSLMLAIGLIAGAQPTPAQENTDCSSAARVCRQACSVLGAIGNVLGQSGTKGECRAKCDARRSQCEAAASAVRPSDSAAAPAAISTSPPASVEREADARPVGASAGTTCLRFIERRGNVRRLSNECRHGVFMIGREGGSCGATDLTRYSSPFDLPMGPQWRESSKTFAGDAGEPVAVCRYIKLSLAARCACPEGADLPAELAVLRAAYAAPLSANAKPAVPRQGGGETLPATTASRQDHDATTVPAAQTEAPVARPVAATGQGFVLLTWKHHGRNPLVDKVHVTYDTKVLRPADAEALRRPNWDPYGGLGREAHMYYFKNSYRGGTLAFLTSEASLESFLRDLERGDRARSRDEVRIDRLGSHASASTQEQAETSAKSQAQAARPAGAAGDGLVLLTWKRHSINPLVDRVPLVMYNDGEVRPVAAQALHRPNWSDYMPGGAEYLVYRLKATYSVGGNTMALLVSEAQLDRYLREIERGDQARSRDEVRIDRLRSDASALPR